MLYLDLFRSRYVESAPVTGLVIPTDINYLRRLYIFNKDQISKYYRERNFTVKNTHILSRILEHFPTYINYDDYKYVDYALEKVKYLAKHFKFTSEIEHGIVHPPYFFGNDGEEIILATYEDFNVTNTVTNWETTSAVRILKTDRDNSRLLLPLGTDDGNRRSLSTVMINIPKLALQYRQFVKKQFINMNNGGIVLNKNHFVIKYVLSNMMEDIIDFMLLNKVMNKFYGKEDVQVKFRHRFKIFEPTTQLNRYVDQTLDVITTKKIDFVNVLHNIQLVFKIDASELLLLPEVGYTNNVKWSLFISRLDHMLFLYDVSSKSGGLNLNRHYINDWKRLATRLLRDNQIKDNFLYETEKDIMEKIYRLSNL